MKKYSAVRFAKLFKNGQSQTVGLPKTPQKAVDLALKRVSEIEVES